MKSSFLIFAAYAVLVIFISLLPGKFPSNMVKEGGPIEILSAAGYFMFCLLIFFFNFMKITSNRFAPGFFVFLLGLRELDFHDRFTTMGIFKIRFFTSSDVPVAEKIIVIIFIFSLLCYAFFYLRNALPAYKRDLKSLRTYAVSVACALVCMVFSKFIDSNSDMFIAIFHTFQDPATFSFILEECMELFIPIFFIQGLIQYSRIKTS